MALPPFRGKEGIRIANRRLTPLPRPEESRFRRYVAFSTRPSREPSRHFRRDVLAAPQEPQPEPSAAHAPYATRGTTKHAADRRRNTPRDSQDCTALDSPIKLIDLVAKLTRIPVHLDRSLEHVESGPAALEFGLAVLEFCLAVPEFCLAVLEFCLAVLEFGLAVLEFGLAAPEFGSEIFRLVTQPVRVRCHHLVPAVEKDAQPCRARRREQKGRRIHLAECRQVVTVPLLLVVQGSRRFVGLPPSIHARDRRAATHAH